MRPDRSGVVLRGGLGPGQALVPGIALIFVLFGIILAPFGFHIIDIDTDAASFAVVAQLALTVILFNQAAALDLTAVVRRREVTFRLLVIGIPLALALGTATCAAG